MRISTINASIVDSNGWNLRSEAKDLELAKHLKSTAKLDIQKADIRR